MLEARDSFALGDTIVLPGETRHIRLSVSESYVSTPVEIPLTIINGIGEGPILMVSAASHGDECNGTAIVRQLIYDVDHSSLRGVLVCAPVLNLPGFLRNERDLPDGRDLNRNFPGKPDGNSAQRIANRIFTMIVQKCDYGLDLHTATRGRSNILQVRGDMSSTEMRRLAKAFGSEIVIDEPGLQGTLRRAATESGIPTLTAEIGESQRFEKQLVVAGLKGVMNVLYELGMMKGKPAPPLFQVIVKKTEWVRADRGGILEMTTAPRALVAEGEELCTITNPFGKEVGSVRAPFTGMVVGITNYPMVSPGSPICHLVKLDKTLATVEAALRREKAHGQDVTVCVPLVTAQPAVIPPAGVPAAGSGAAAPAPENAAPAAASAPDAAQAPAPAQPSVPALAPAPVLEAAPAQGQAPAQLSDSARPPAPVQPAATPSEPKDSDKETMEEPPEPPAERPSDGRHNGRANGRPPRKEKNGKEVHEHKEKADRKENAEREPARPEAPRRPPKAPPADEQASSHPNHEEHTSEYYEDYDEDAEPEERE